MSFNVSGRIFLAQLTHPDPADPLADLFARRHAVADAEAAREEIRQIAADNESRAFIRQLTKTTEETTEEN